MNNGKEKNKENTKEEYKVNYFFAEDSKININEILKNSFLLSLKAEEKYVENRLNMYQILRELWYNICRRLLNGKVQKIMAIMRRYISLEI